MMTLSPESYLESLDSTQLAQLVLALEQLGLVSAPAALPTTPNPTRSVVINESNHSHASPSLSGGGATSNVVDAAVSVTTVPVTNTKSLPPPRKCNKASRGRSSGSGGQHAHTAARCTWYTVTVGYEVGIFQGWNVVAPLVLGVDGAVYLPHPSHAAACAYYANAMASDEVEIILTDNEDDA